MIKMVVFLGNKGNQYEKTRHNIGWIFENILDNSQVKQSKFNSLYYKDDNGVINLLPQKMMNLSGDSVVKAMNFFKIKIEEILVVHDDLETTFGSFKLKKSGGLGGHNGLRSIKEKTGSVNFFRLALGISRPAHGSVSSYVLSRFSIQEDGELPLYLKSVIPYYKDLISDKIKADGKKIKILEQIKD